ncbi:MAG: calcium-translocating P-type ATPase, PMCA-type [Prevotellaceae bacterium]|jgi:Ca2+-transporting ATPase|nr:calcium-translocating P-type ATPase, PMCA-type [Prevotellaceae bacterium]
MEHKKHYTGLNDQQITESRNKHGENVLTPPKRDPIWKLFLEKFNDPIIRILLIAAVLSLGISFTNGHYAETTGIFCAILLATGVGFWFEYDANKKFDILNTVNDVTPVKVIRDGNISEIPKRDVVVGDIIVLETGEEIPADGELLEAISLQVNESSLTGEPVISKTTNPENFKPDATYPSNMVLRGTTVVDGHGIMEVALVGDATEFGKVAQEATAKSEEETPLNKQLDKLAKFIGVVGFTVAILTFLALFFKDIVNGVAIYTWQQLGFLAIVFVSVLIAFAKVWVPIVYDAKMLLGCKDSNVPNTIENGSWLRWMLIGLVTFIVLMAGGYPIGIDPFDTNSWMSIDTAGDILQYFMVAVTLIVVAVPEGLPMSVTLSLAMSMRRMLQTNNLVRKMHACETMGAATVICTDKTGTLTQNQMQVYETCFCGLNNDQALINDEASKLITEGIAANSTAFLDYSDPKKIKSLGNPTEAALLLRLHDVNINYLDLREDAEVVERLTFSTERKFMATIVQSPLLNKRVLYMKGAPEIVLGKCNNVLTENGYKPIAEKKKEVEQLLLQYQNKAMRTLGFAFCYLEDNDSRSIEAIVKSGLTLLGVVAISDPIRKDVPPAVDRCLDAGIDVKIVTGDTPATAMEIGRQIGIWEENDRKDYNLITGSDFEALSNEEALKRIQDLKIMCRARPTDKQRLVQLLQQRGEVVAVTGDGTNDAPALNYAQVGLSMGSGTSVAKEASDITLLDDSFNSIATAVMWGRSLYQNIQRFILFQLTINVAALILVFFGSIFGQELPLTVTQMLWVNLIMDTFAAAALASLPPNPNVMENKPRRNNDFIISPVMRKNILFVGISFVVLLLALSLYYTHTDGIITAEYELSVFFTIFVMLQFWNMFNAKAFNSGKSAFSNLKNSPGFLISASAILIGQLLIVEFGGDVFRTVPITFRDWMLIIGSTSIVLWIGEISRAVKRAKAKHQ